MDPGEEAATPSHNQNNNSQQGTATPTSNYNLLLHQIQTLSDLQSGGGIQNADPSLQAAYVLRLQQQAAQIKKLLKILNNSSQAASLSHLNSKSESSINETGGYESLWEVSEKGPQSEEISTEPSEVDESEDVVIGSDD